MRGLLVWQPVDSGGRYPAASHRPADSACSAQGWSPRTSTVTQGGHISTEPRINERIRVPEVRLVGPAGEQVGIVAINDALRLAQEADLDLVEVAPMARPPVCKLMDYGKFKYESALKARESRKNQAQTVIKEIKLRPKIDPHDYGTKKGHVERFLKQGDKVKVTIMFRGREQSRPELGFKLLQRLAGDIEELGFVESSPKQDGRNMIMVLGPHKRKADAMAAAKADRASRANARGAVSDDSAESAAPPTESRAKAAQRAAVASARDRAEAEAPETAETTGPDAGQLAATQQVAADPSSAGQAAEAAEAAEEQPPAKVAETATDAEPKAAAAKPAAARQTAPGAPKPASRAAATPKPAAPRSTPASAARPGPAGGSAPKPTAPRGTSAAARPGTSAPGSSAAKPGPARRATDSPVPGPRAGAADKAVAADKAGTAAAPKESGEAKS
jgi:translation initiation factor IF-3